MIPNAEAKLESLLDQNEMEGPAFKIKEDLRITWVGKFIRKRSAEELSQLVDIINLCEVGCDAGIFVVA